MSRYEEIKGKAASIFPYKAMAEAALKQGDLHKAFEHARTFGTKSKELFDEYPDMLAAAIVYLNASQFMASVAERFKDTEQAVYLTHWTALVNVSKLLEEGIDNENCCQLLLSQVQYCLLSFNELANKQYPDEQYAGAIMYGYVNLYFQLYHRLARINPNNVLVTGSAKQLFQQLIQGGFKQNDDFPKSVCDNLSTIASFLSRLGII